MANSAILKTALQALQDYERRKAESPSRDRCQSGGLVFPRCPQCASYDLYREKNIGEYECQTCGLQGIDEATARRGLDEATIRRLQ